MADQFRVAVLGEQVEFADHARDVAGQLLRLGVEVAGVKEVIPGELFLHVGHDFQGLVVAVHSRRKWPNFSCRRDCLVLFFFQETPQEFENHG